jgi:four helix bundle protein
LINGNAEDPMRDYKDLVVWRRSHTLTLTLYRATESFPKSEMFGLTSQIRRALASIPTNLAEGCGRWGDGDMGRFVQITMGSASEVDYQLVLAKGSRLPSEG